MYPFIFQHMQQVLQKKEALTHFMPLISLYTPWKRQKAKGIERNRWHEVIKIKRGISSKFVISLKLHQNIVFHIVFHLAFYFVTYVHSSFVHSFMDLLNWAIKDQCFHHLETSCIFALQINWLVSIWRENWSLMD